MNCVQYAGQLQTSSCAIFSINAKQNNKHHKTVGAGGGRVTLQCPKEHEALNGQRGHTPYTRMCTGGKRKKKSEKQLDKISESLNKLEMLLCG